MSSFSKSCVSAAIFSLALLGMNAGAAHAEEVIDLAWVQRHLYTRLLPPITSVEVFEISPEAAIATSSPSETFPIRPYNETRNVSKKVELTDKQAQELATLWRGLIAGDTHATCHTPRYGVRFYRESTELLGRGRQLLFETSISFECANFYVPDLYPGGGFIFFSFNADQKKARALKAWLEQAVLDLK